MVAQADYSTRHDISALAPQDSWLFFPGKLVRELILDALSPIAHAENGSWKLSGCGWEPEVWRDGENGFDPSARRGCRGRELRLECDRAVEKTVEDLVVIQQPIGSEVPHGIAAEGPIGIVIGEIDDRNAMAGTDPA